MVLEDAKKQFGLFEDSESGKEHYSRPDDILSIGNINVNSIHYIFKKPDYKFFGIIIRIENNCFYDTANEIKNLFGNPMKSENLYTIIGNFVKLQYI